MDDIKGKKFLLIGGSSVDRFTAYKNIIEHVEILSHKKMDDIKGKKFLLIGGSSVDRFTAYKNIIEHVETYMVEPDPNHMARSLIGNNFYVYDYKDHSKDEHHANEIIKILNKNNIVVDGLLTFTDGTIILAAILCKKLGLRGMPVEAATCVKSKFETMECLRKNPEASRYYVPSYKIQSHEDIDEAAKYIEFPAFIKMEYGTSSVAATTLENAVECHKYLDDIRENETFDPHLLGNSFGFGLVLMEYLEESEHDVDVVMYDGELLAGFIRDKGEPHRPHFLQSCALMPSRIDKKYQQALIEGAFLCCKAIGITSGIINSEFKFTQNGPKLLEINGRLGSGYVVDWISNVYGVQYLLCGFLIACGIKPRIARNIYDIPKISRLGIDVPKVYINDSVEKKVEELVREGSIEYVKRPGGKMQMVVQGYDAIKQKEKLTSVCQHVLGEVTHFSMEGMLNSIFTCTDWLVTDSRQKS